MIGHVRPVQRPDITVNSMMGGLTHGFEMNTFEIASDLARRLDAQCNYLAAPIYAGSPESCATILEQDVFREAFERIASVDVALVSVGDMSNRSLQIRYGLPPDVSAEDLVRAGAVGDIMGRFLDADGHPVDHPLSRRVIAPSLETLRAIPRVIIASGGLHKAAIVAAVLKARLCSVLISDEDTARKALTLFET
jgi:DNA-binding transcriptional regulator LsrR (DeoR family)